MSTIGTSAQLLEDYRRQQRDAHRRAEKAQIESETWGKAVSMLQDLIDAQTKKEPR